MTATFPRSIKRYVLTFAIGIATLTGIASITGCHKAPDADVATNDSGPDPADANMAPVDGNQQQAAAPVQRTAPARVLPARLQNESQQSAEEYAQNGNQADAPVGSQQTQPNQDDTYDQNYENQVDAGQQALEADAPPPPLPTYQQPEAPAPNYIWTPGYWAYAPVGYYWVPGAWVFAPYPGALWTPGYWGFFGNRYLFHRGFWGPHIGFYGGVNYGFGYTGSGYHGGYWNGNNFYYNRAVNRINATRITNVYNRTVVVNNNYNRISYNGGRGGIPVRPQPAEIAAMRGPRTPPMSAQLQNQRQAAQNRQQFYNQNQGRPAIVAAPRPFAADHGISPVARPMPVSLSRPSQPYNQQLPQSRPVQPQVQPVRPAQPQLHESQTRPANPAPAPIRTTQSQVRPMPQPQRPIQPQQEVRPAPETQPRPAPENQVRPAPQPQPRPVQPQPQLQRPAEPPMQHPTPEARPQPHVQQRPAPQEKKTPPPSHGEGHSR
jgi:WXXGXW repeat (2 copies)